MPKNYDSIPDARLFKDFQISQTDIFLTELLIDPTEEDKKRLESEKKTCEIIKKIMKDRFPQEKIRMYLNIGFPREG